MCGRFTRKYSWRELWELYMLRGGLLTSNVQPRYNVCPTTTIDAIVEEVGYDSEAAFSRAFKKMIGIPPSAWRRGVRSRR